MRRKAIILLVLALVAGSMAPVAEAAKRRKKPVPVDQVFHLVWGGEACALSVSADLGNPEESCSDTFWGATGDLSGGPAIIPAVDGIPLTLDATKPIRAKLAVQSWYFAGVGPDVMGIGEAEVHAVLTGVSGGEEITIGEATSEPYVVTPASADYEVEFEIQPPAELAKKVFEEITLSLQTQGNQLFHGVFPADGSSTLTFGTFAIPK